MKPQSSKEMDRWKLHKNLNRRIKSRLRHKTKFSRLFSQVYLTWWVSPRYRNQGLNLRHLQIQHQQYLRNQSFPSSLRTLTLQFSSWTRGRLSKTSWQRSSNSNFWKTCRFECNKTSNFKTWAKEEPQSKTRTAVKLSQMLPRENSTMKNWLGTWSKASLPAMMSKARDGKLTPNHAIT